jgi:hypothetical protein
MDKYECPHCGDDVPLARWALGRKYQCCLACGEKHARYERQGWTVAPINKSNYMLFTDVSLLKQLNPKRTQA